MSGRLVWLFGPVGASALLFIASRVLSNRFAAGLPVARGISPEFAAWVSVGATVVVVVVWLMSSGRSSEDEE